MILDAVRPRDRDTALVALLSGVISVAAFFYYFSHGELLLYGDAVAHINIARRVFDSRTPGLLQLGTVWLPLPHLLMIPFLISDWLWRTGVGGSIPSMTAYVFGVVGIFKLTRSVLETESPQFARLAPWGAVLAYAANPNLIYLQTTAMTEPIYLALSIWTLVHFSDFLHAANAARTRDSTLIKCGLCLAAACLTRYDAWFLGGVLCILALVTRRRHGTSNRSLAKFVLLAVAAPTLWLAYNAAIYRNPLEFSNGPYSAKAIEKKTSVPGTPPHPGAGNLPVSASYFLKSAELNVARGDWGRFWLLLALLGTAVACTGFWNSIPALLLWIPLPFYMLSIAYGGVPIFLPVWWPGSHYNVRYGLELLPAFAVFVTIAAVFAIKLVRNRNLRLVAAIALLGFMLASYASIWRDPICRQEAWANSRTRIALERELAAYLKALPQGSTLLMYWGDHVGALQDAGIPLRRVINEGNHRVWKQ
ncbi:MAG TPA: hypothetical protein VGV15_11925, partial [Terriglobales bacterium]|nr:hypothetical protein [Terriglobales bacterium]